MTNHEQLLGNLLAIIHRDGGHYIDQHGWEKSVEDAIEKWSYTQVLLEERVSRRSLVRKAESFLEDTLQLKAMPGGDWNGMEVAILAALDEREFALSWPIDPPVGSPTARATCPLPPPWPMTA